MNPVLGQWLEFLGGSAIGAVLVAIVTGIINRKKTAAEAKKTEAESETEKHKGDVTGLEGVIAASERVIQWAETRIKNLTEKVQAQDARISILEDEQVETLRKMLEMQKDLTERESKIRQLEQEKIDQQIELNRLQEANKLLQERVRVQAETIEYQATQIKELQREMAIIRGGGNCA